MTIKSEFAKREEAEAWAAQRGWTCNSNIVDGSHICQFLMGYDVMAYGYTWAEAIADAEDKLCEACGEIHGPNHRRAK